MKTDDRPVAETATLHVYTFAVPIRGVWYGLVKANTAAEARRKVDERHSDAEGWDSEIDWHGKARVRLDE